MPSIYLIRHGQASFAKQNYDLLSPLGEEQARHLGKSLVHRIASVDHVVTGSMVRHKQTAQHCLEGLSCALPEISEDDGWNEYDHQQILHRLSDDFATPEGIQRHVAQQPNPKAAFESLFNEAVHRWMSGDHDGDYSESYIQFKTRVNRALDDLVAQHANAGNILVFTSGGPIALLTQALMQTGESRLTQLNWTLVNCGITKLVKTKDRLFLSTLNEHSHFEGSNTHMITYK